MKLMQFWYAYIVIAAAVLAAIFLQMHGGRNTKGDGRGAIAAASKADPPAVTVYYDDYGFDPNLLTVPIGTQVSVKNISTGSELYFEALPGQPNQNPALDLGTVPRNQSKTFTISRAGIWQYQGNHDPSTRGVIQTGKPSLRPYMYPNATIASGHITIKDDDYGFMPNEIRVPVGTIVTLVNTTDDTQSGPTHYYQVPDADTENPALNVGILRKKQSQSFTLTSKGTWLLQNVDQPPAKGLARITAY